MSFYSWDQRQIEANQRSRYLALQKRQELQMTRKVSAQIGMTRKSIFRSGDRSLRSSMRRGLKLGSNIGLGLARKRLIFAKLVRGMLRSPGLGVPFFFLRGISLTRAMRILILKIIRKKNDIWMFALRQMWLNDARAKAMAGQQLRAEFAWLKISVSEKDNIFKMYATIQDGRDNVASQTNDYYKDRLHQMKQTATNGKWAAKSLWNDMEK